MHNAGLAADFGAHQHWREGVSRALDGYRRWLREQDFGDPEADAHLAQLLERLTGEKLTVAFVAEFSRGKSELINALFFADYGQRLLPSAAGRTTMCPTELRYDEDEPVGLRLLPVDTRRDSTPLADYRERPGAWTHMPFSLESAATIRAALARVSETRRVDADTARAYGFYPGGDAGAEIPAWRHAVVNFPHPLLRQGLVILDTPGLNALGNEPELTLSLLPSAHAVLFLLAADAGVTQSDLDVWRRYIAARADGKLVALNKIDGLWDELKDPAEVAAEIGRQRQASAELLGVPEARVFALSAQKGLVAKVGGDAALLARSGLPVLERALADALIPARRVIVGNVIRADADGLLRDATLVLETRLAGARAQREELAQLRGQNGDIAEHMRQKTTDEKAAFARGLQRFYAMRGIFSEQANALYAHLSRETLQGMVSDTRRAMERSRLSSGVRAAMQEFFIAAKGHVRDAGLHVAEITRMMDAMYRRFSAEFGMAPVAPMGFSLAAHEQEVTRLEEVYHDEFDHLRAMLVNEQHVLAGKFFETVASRVSQAFARAGRDLERWLKAVMAPMERHVRDYQAQLRGRIESLERVLQASENLEVRLAELEREEEALAERLAQLQGFEAAIHAALSDRARLPAGAGAAVGATV